MAVAPDPGRKQFAFSDAKSENKVMARLSQKYPIKSQAELLRTMKDTHILITGGAGFIGSHLSDELMPRGLNVLVLDNLSSGSLGNIEKWFGSRSFSFTNHDLLDRPNMKTLEDCEVVFHLAANPEVRTSSIDPETHYQQNIQATFNLLEAIRESGSVETLVFSSSSTVYGDVAAIPTREDYGPLKPVSVYGASKLSCEALITAYAHTYGFRALIYRLANIVGSRSRHGVVCDFIRKLRSNPRELEILGDGTQAKSYLHVEDCVKAILVGLEKTGNQVETFNIGSEDRITVKTLADIVVDEMGLENVKYQFTGGVNGGRGWVGDVKDMLLETSKLVSRGWSPKHNSEQSVRRAVRETLEGKRDL
jgi:UDP-glucose 4-epimerase